MAKPTLDEAIEEQKVLTDRASQITQQQQALQEELSQLNTRYIHLNGYIQALSPEMGEVEMTQGLEAVKDPEE